MGDLFIAASLRPMSLGLLTPSAEEAGAYGVQPGREEPGFMPEPPSSACSDASSRLLDACAISLSRWFIAMRQCLHRERVRQQLFREEYGLPKSAKLPYERQPPTQAEKSAAETSEALIRAMFGDSPADYAKDRFLHALATGDMRSFKIRLILLRIRDSLKDTPLYKTFSEGLENCIDRTESLSGCKPDPSPRRMSRAEQDKKRRREEQREEESRRNPELPLEWGNSTKDANITCNDKAPNEDEDKNGDGSAEDSAIVDSKRKDTAEDCNDKGQDIEPEVLRGTFSKSSKSRKCGVQDIEKTGGRPKNYIAKKRRRRNNVDAESQDIEPVTNSVTVTLAPKKRKRGTICRKAREYESVDQILEDIEDGKIVPYESGDEICEDLKAGKITAVEALMFTSALERYSSQVPDMAPGVDDMDDDTDWDGESPEDELDEDVDRERSERPDFSINPNGFGGCDGGYSSSEAEWNTDDEW